jgi:hypothetical protein
MFVTPTKSKSGLDWNTATPTECRQEMRKLNKAGVQFTVNGEKRNWTQVTTIALREFISNYYNSAVKQDCTPGTYAPIYAKVSEVEGLELLSNLQNAVQKVTDYYSSPKQVVENIVEQVTESDLNLELEILTDIER